jgi:hypothetical protein
MKTARQFFAIFSALSAFRTPASFLIATLFLGSAVFADQKGTVPIYCSDSPPIAFAVGKIRSALLASGYQVEERRLGDLKQTGNSASRLVLATIGDSHVLEALKADGGEGPTGLIQEGFALRETVQAGRATYWVIGGDTTGAMYGGLEVAEHLLANPGWKGPSPREVNPRFRIRAFKHNLPWSSYRVHESLNLHYSTCRDLAYWHRLLDMMAENRLNVLTLWALHPWPYMIRAANFPEACPLTDAELEQWQHFWRELFRMAKDRGVDTYMVNFNIWVSPKFALIHGSKTYNITQHYNGEGDYSELVQRYNRESVAQVIDEYPDLTGIAVSANERMLGVSDQEMEDWIMSTYLGAMEDAGRPIQFMHRGHTQPDPAITRAALEKNADRLPETVWVPLKFNWSHGHATPKLVYIHGGSDSDVWWNPKPRNYKLVWTIRNEDFFVLRWGQSDFIREMISQNGHDYVGGFQIGSETYIPAKEYITRPGPHLTWDYGFEKQWLFYMMWGRLLFDPSTPDKVFQAAFDRRYGAGTGTRLVGAHNLAGRMPLRLASLYAATWDFTLYSEGFLSGYYPWRGGYYDNVSPFISVDELIDNPPLDPDYVSIKEFVEGQLSGKAFPTEAVTPPLLADALERDGRQALELLRPLETEDPTLLHEIADVRAWSYLSLYFAEKIRGGMALHKSRKTGDSDRSQAILHLRKAAGHWEQVIGVTEPYLDSIPLLHFGDDFYYWKFEKPVSRFSWKAFRDQVQRDIELAGK